MTYLFATNLDIKYEKEEANSLRFLTSVKGIKSFINGKNKIVILSHRGRPEGRDMSLSLKPFKKLFENKLREKIIFLDNNNLAKAREKVQKSAPGSIFLLENTRFLKGEKENSSKLAKELASLGDIFINDDFATAHRESASNVGITKYIPSKMGPNFKKEVASLTKAVKKPKHPYVLILGGAKMTDKIGVIKNLSSKADYILLGGGVANTVLKAGGVDIGGSIYEPEMLKIAKNLSKNKKMVIPVDYSKDTKENKSRILDIGPKTVKKYTDIISSAKTIIWGGPMGYYEDRRFAKGSHAVAHAIAKSDAFSIVGGGETSAIINDCGLNNKIDLVSTGGGAMLDFLSGKKMPAIEALKKHNFQL